MAMFSKNQLGATMLAGLLVFAAGAQAQEKKTFTDSQQEEIRAIVKDYLIKNPQVLYEALVEVDRYQSEMQQQAAREALKEVQSVVFDSANNIVAGNPKGDVTVVEFFDYNCGYCKSALSDVKKLVDGDGKVRVILRDLPILGKDSVDASKVSLAVMKQLDGEKMFRFHTALLETQGRVNGERAREVAKGLGVDMARLEKDINSEDIRSALLENIQIGDKLGLNGTPAFIVGDKIIPGMAGLKPLQQFVGDMRKCGKTSC